ncbi:Rod shape-determining protein MreD [Deinococcus sp. LM3]|uniref:Rod shape-determining protein MreD n=1 Tax=unclassified Deinococcus TaxID=2623546 RepID=UPI000993C584|nr:Rod shape-determining protein MreD [Deinococcus sp. LM3]OOV15467.1 Rod shape-determining protein MreD [Deinococcus sp. LM3]
MRNAYPVPRGPLRWVKLIVYAALLIAAQGLLSRLSDAAGIPAPDLFLLTGAALVWRLPPPWAVLAAYGVGLGQDLLGSGALGLHAAGVAGGALLTLLVRRYVADSGVFQMLLTVLMAVVGEWLAFLILNYWLRADLITADLLRTTVPLVFAGTLVLYPLWERVVAWAFGSRSGPEEHLA